MKKFILTISILSFIFGCENQTISPLEQAQRDYISGMMDLHWKTWHEGKYYFNPDKTFEQCKADYEKNLFEAEKATASSNDPVHNAAAQSKLLVSGMKQDDYQLLKQQDLPPDVHTTRISYNHVGLAGKQ